jgi:hypothetical protein
VWMTSLIRRAVAIRADLAARPLGGEEGKRRWTMVNNGRAKQDAGKKQKAAARALSRMTDRGAGEWYFGLCPKCKKYDGCLNVGPGHWYFCKEHRLRWFVGSNLFSSWRDETEAEQRRRYEKLGFDRYKDVEPFYPDMEDVQPLDEESNGEKPTVRRKRSGRPRLTQVRNRRKKRD